MKILYAVAFAAGIIAVTLTAYADIPMKPGQISPQQYLCKTADTGPKILYSLFINPASVIVQDAKNVIAKGQILEVDFRDEGDPVQYLINDVVIRVTDKPNIYIAKFRWAYQAMMELVVNLDEGKGYVHPDGDNSEEQPVRVLHCKRARSIK